MSPKMKVAQKGINEILEALANTNCPNGCKCIFCQTFESGYRAALEDAEIEAKRKLRDHKAKG